MGAAVASYAFPGCAERSCDVLDCAAICASPRPVSDSLQYPSLLKSISDSRGTCTESVSCHSGSLVKGKVGLTGEWLFVYYEGHMENFLTDLGFSNKECIEARDQNFAVGKKELKIDHEGNTLSIKTKTSTSWSAVTEFTVGQHSQCTHGFRGEPCHVDANWIDRGRTLRVQTTPVRKRDRAAGLGSVREYYKDGNHLVCQITSPCGTTIKQYYSRVDRIGDFLELRSWHAASRENNGR